MQPLSETAFAKINLALHVRRRRNDGYHELETLFAFVDSGDGLTAGLAADISLEVTGRFGTGLSSGADNLVFRAARLLHSHFGVKQGAALQLDKKLPVASGIGGGSADAAATARLLNRLWKLGASNAELEELLAQLGADVPACVQSRTARGGGTGTALSSVSNDDVVSMPILLVNPLVPVATRPVFAAWDGVDRGALVGGSALESALSGRNDLKDAAISICPSIADVQVALDASSPVISRMCGSGATCFALYDSADARDAACSDVIAAHPEWWTLVGALR